MRKSKNNQSWNRSIIIGLVLFLLFVGLTSTYNILNKVVNKTTKISDYKVIGEHLLGLSKPTKILVLFQNNAESRPGGGFIGTVGYITVDKGKIKSEPVRSVYYYDYQIREIREATEAAGEDIASINYVLRDSGQYLDWPTNAKAAIKLFELQPDKEVDMVIGLTPEVLKFLLDKTGPVYLQNYNKTINASNIIETLQQEVEYGQDKVDGKDPKTILSEVANQLIGRLSEKSVLELNDLGQQMQDLIKKRQIMMYSKNYDVAASLKQIGFDGSVVSNTGDYFLLTENNYSIDKSSAFIDREIDRKVEINTNGEVEVKLIIRRTQTLEQSFPYTDPKDGGYTFLIKPNKSYMKFAIPKSSKITSTSESVTLTQKDSEGGYDVYQFNSELTPLLTAEYLVSYKLPFRLTGENGSVLNSYLQYQNGGWPYRLKQTVAAPENWEFSASNRNDVTSNGQTVRYNGLVDRDFYWSIVYAKD